jgi:hypothetical protein
MAQVALEIQNNAALRPNVANIPSSFSNALDTVSTRALELERTGTLIFLRCDLRRHFWELQSL